METRRTAVGRASVAVVVVVVAAVAFGVYGLARPPTTETSYVTTNAYETTAKTFTTTVYENVKFTGTCTAVSYFLPDTVLESVTNVTLVSGSSTKYSMSVISMIYPGTTTLGTSTYGASTFGNGTALLTIVSTSVNSNYIPSSGWTVTTCTFAP